MLFSVRSFLSQVFAALVGLPFASALRSSAILGGCDVNTGTVSHYLIVERLGDGGTGRWIYFDSTPFGQCADLEASGCGGEAVQVSQNRRRAAT